MTDQEKSRLLAAGYTEKEIIKHTRWIEMGLQLPPPEKVQFRKDLPLVLFLAALVILHWLTPGGLLWQSGYVVGQILKYLYSLII